MAKREVKRIVTESECKCSKSEIFLLLNFPLDFAYLQYFVAKGYKDKPSYTTRGIFYLDNKGFVVLGAIGSNKLQVKCRNSNCFEELDKLEAIIKEM